jgi:hypothetical protein
MGTREIAEQIAKSVGFDTNSMSRDSEQRLTSAIDAALLKTLQDQRERAVMQREAVAEMIYDWIHEQQVTHRRTYNQIPENQKSTYCGIADRVIARLFRRDSTGEDSNATES